MITFQPNMKRSLSQRYFCEELDRDVVFIEYFSFPYNNSLWSHEVAPGVLTCQLYMVGKGVLFAPKPITGISSQVVARQPDQLERLASYCVL